MVPPLAGATQHCLPLLAVCSCCLSLRLPLPRFCPASPQAMLVTGDRLLAAEVRTLEAEESSTDLDTLLFQLAACQQLAAGGAGREYTPEDREGEQRFVGLRAGSGCDAVLCHLRQLAMEQPVAGPTSNSACTKLDSLPSSTSRPSPTVLGKSSRRLLAYAVQRKWVAATRTLLAAVAADQPAAEAMAAVSGGSACHANQWLEGGANSGLASHASHHRALPRCHLCHFHPALCPPRLNRRWM